MTDAAQLSGNLNISLKSSTRIVMHLPSASTWINLLHIIQPRAKVCRQWCEPPCSPHAASGHKYLHIVALLQDCFATLLFSWWVGLPDYSLFGPSACLPCTVAWWVFVVKWYAGGGEQRPCNFSEEVSCFVTLCNGELLFSLPLPLNGPHHSNMWQWSIWMSLTRAALRSSLHSPHSLNRSNWIKETGGGGELLVKQTKGLLTSPMTSYLQEKRKRTVPFTKQFAAVMVQE